jgi:hypothetical protein
VRFFCIDFILSKMKNSGTKLVIICLFRVLGLLQQLRYQEEGRAGACGQVQPINPAVSSWVLRPPFHRAVGTTKKSPPPVNCSPSPSRFSTIGGLGQPRTRQPVLRIIQGYVSDSPPMRRMKMGESGASGGGGGLVALCTDFCPAEEVRMR